MPIPPQSVEDRESKLPERLRIGRVDREEAAAAYRRYQGTRTTEGDRCRAVEWERGRGDGVEIDAVKEAERLREKRGEAVRSAEKVREIVEGCPVLYRAPLLRFAAAPEERRGNREERREAKRLTRAFVTGANAEPLGGRGEKTQPENGSSTRDSGNDRMTEQ